MGTADISSPFYRLIPKGIGFPGPTPPRGGDESNARTYTVQVEKWRRELLKAYGYKTARDDEIARILFVKAAFINAQPNKEDANAAKKALKLLACDQSTLFADDDPFYRKNRLNAAFISNRREPRQKQKSSEFKNLCIDIAAKNYSKKPSPMVRHLLSEIVDHARRNHISVRDWLYSEKHMKPLPDTNVTSDDDKSRINYSLWDTDRLDIELCRKDFERFLAKCGRTVNMEELYCRKFIHRVLLTYIKYMEEHKNIPTHFPEASTYRDDLRDFRTVPALQKRLKRLESLEKEYDTRLAPTADLYKRDEWGIETKECGTERETWIPKMCDAICNFFKSLNLPTKHHDILGKRVRSAFDYKRDNRIPEKLVPIFLLNMVMACSQRVFSDPVDDTIQPSEILTVKHLLQFSRVDQAKQRCAQLVLLKTLCEIMELPLDAEVENLKEYLFLYGKTVLSFDELKIWRRWLKGNYELLPQIGLPLCFLNYCAQCVPPQYKKLNYRIASRLRSGGYHRFYRKNRQILVSLSRQRNLLHRSSVDKYRQVWSNPRLGYDEREKVLENLLKEIPIDLSEFDKKTLDFSEFGKEPDSNSKREAETKELKHLILETILQMQIRRDAIQTLLEGFSILYDFPLAKAYGKRVDFKFIEAGKWDEALDKP